MGEKLERKIRDLYRMIGDAERKLKDAPIHERSIIEVGLKAMRGELYLLLKRKN